jgi:hypothetical protein
MRFIVSNPGIKTAWAARMNRWLNGTPAMMLLVSSLCALAAAPAGAQVVPDQDAAVVVARLDLTAAALTTTSAAQATPTPSSHPPSTTPPPTAQSTTTPPSLPDPGPRRRGSMVGYIEDTVVSTKIRVRFDVGLHGHTPDRAEFFYAKCGCYRGLTVNDPAYDPNAGGPAPGIATDINFQQLYVQGEYAASERLSVFAELPIRWLQPQAFAPNTGAFANQSGLSDLRAGVKLGLTETATQLLTAQVKAYFPTGDGRKGLGTEHASLEPAILYYQQLSERAAVESQFSVWLPIGGADGVPTAGDEKFAGRVLSYGIGPSFDLYRRGTVRFAPVVELVGWHVLSGFQTATPADASGTNIVNLKFGARTSWGSGNSIYAGYGRALTEADWYNDILRFEYRVSF